MGRRLLWKRSRGASEEKAKGQPSDFLKEAENSRVCISLLGQLLLSEAWGLQPLHGSQAGRPACTCLRGPARALH